MPLEETAKDTPPPDAPIVEPAPSDAATSAAPPAEPAAEEVDSTPGEAKEEEPAEKVEGEEPEKPAEPEATPKESAILRSLKKREARHVEREKVFARERAEFQAYVAKLNPQVAAFNAERELAAKDPLKYLADVHGFSIDDLGRRIINDGRPSAEEQAKREKSEYDKRIAALEERERLAAEERQKQAGVEARRNVEAQFVKLATDNAAKLPMIARRYAGDAAALAARGHLASDELTATLGRPPAWTEVLAHIEKDLRRTAELIAPKSSATVTTETGPTVTKGSEKTGQKGQPAAGTNAPTLTGKGAAQRASLPKDPLTETPEEERARVIAAIEKAKRDRVA